MTRLVVTIPAYNEESSIAKVIQNIPRDCCEEVKVLVVDDGSTDNTAQVAYEAGADMVISHVQNLGLAASYRDSLEVSTEQLHADIVVNIDADGQYEPKEIPKLVKPILDHQADIVLGSRFKGTIEDMKWSKKAGNRLATRIVSRAAGQKFSDCQTGYRALSREAAFRMNVFSNFTYTQESLVNAIHHNMKIVEVPVMFYKREDETNRLFGSVWNYAKRGGATLIRTYLYYKPLRFFLYLGSIVFLIGILLGLRVLIHYITTSWVSPYLPTAVLSSLCIIVGFIVIIFGLIGDMIRINQNLHEEILYRLKKSNANDKTVVNSKLVKNSNE